MPTRDENIAKLEQQIAQQTAKLNKLRQQVRAQERKARTRQLIERGAIAEEIMGCTTEMSNEDFRLLLTFIARVYGNALSGSEEK